LRDAYQENAEQASEINAEWEHVSTEANQHLDEPPEIDDDLDADDEHEGDHEHGSEGAGKDDHDGNDGEDP
jgi:hypothetical protein